MALSLTQIDELTRDTDFIRRVNARIALTARYFLGADIPGTTPHYEARRAFCEQMTNSPSFAPFAWWIVTDSVIVALNDASEITDVHIESVVGAHWNHAIGLDYPVGS